MLKLILVLSATSLAVADPTHAHAADPIADCGTELRSAERDNRLPPGLIHSIAAEESGRLDPVTRRVAPWPWTINVAGVGHSYATAEEAVRAVRGYRSLGVQSIDVGCMQINLLHHPAAFPSLEDAFDPRRNVAYGAQFLTALFRETGTWPGAVAAYHSRTPEIGAAYSGRVMARWTGVPVRASPSAAQPGDANRTPEFLRLVRDAAEDHRRMLANVGATADLVRPDRRRTPRPIRF